MAPSHALLFAFSHFLLLLCFIDEIESYSCPSYIDFDCHDHAYNGSTSLVFPFTTSDRPDCGPCRLKCKNDHTTITFDGYEGEYNVLQIIPDSHTIVLEYPDQTKPDPCEAYIVSNASVPTFRLVSFEILGEHHTFIRCQKKEESPELNKTFNKFCGPEAVYGPYDDEYPSEYISSECSIVQVPLSLEYNSFHTHYNLSDQCQRCLQDKGRCHDLSGGKFTCDYTNKGKTLKIVLGTVLPGLAIISVLLIVYWRRRKNRSDSTTLPITTMPFDRTRSELEGGSMNGVTIFSYTELDEATNHFDTNRELGEGGFGVVYHGKLRDGREVAVKRLYEKNYKRIEQFKNEIKILTELRHQNLVTLYGCTSRHSRELLLVYEYIPNGTVADHLHGDQAKSNLVPWSTRMNIAIETATALTYLHFNEIIHRDVKTNNILLDNNFSVKVADFGLSRLFPADVTHISTAPQGTPGYLDPEYHKCYHLTDKSDVYSFGVVLIELISSLPAVDIGRHRHEINLSDYARNRIQCGAFNELVDPNLGFETDFKVARMTTLVAELAFQCLHHEREVRPSMEEVLEELKKIVNADYDALKAEEMARSTRTTHTMKPPPSPTENDSVELLRNTHQQPRSPDSVMEKWLNSSKSTTTSISSNRSS